MPDSERSNQQRLKRFVADNHEAILRQLRVFVLTWRLASGDAVTPTTESLLSDVVYEALRSSERFDANRSPKAWLLGIALNVVKRRLVEQYRLGQCEPLVRDLYGDIQVEMSDDEIFDRYLPGTGDHRLEQELEAKQDWDALLSDASEADREVLRLKYHDGLRDRRIAKILHITPQAVRQRLSRARQRLRDAHQDQNGDDRS